MRAVKVVEESESEGRSDAGKGCTCWDLRGDVVSASST